MKMFKAVVAFCMLCCTVTTSIAASAESSITIQSKQITIKQAEMVAQKFAKEQNWAYSELKLADTFYDLDESVLGYYFIYLKNNTHLGHVVISANKDREPILQYGEGEIHLDKSTGKRGYYLGFYVKYANHSSDLLQEKSGVLKTLPKSVTNNENVWNYYLLNSTLNSTNISSTYSKKELAVTRIWQRTTGITSPKSACGPTTGAMIVNYYKSQGYNVRGSSYYGGHAGLVNHLYTEMNSGMLGTSLSNFASGLFDHLEHDDSTTTWTGLSYDHPNSAINYDTFKSYIDSNRPSAIRYDFFVSNDSYTNYHFVAAVGYEVIPSGSKYFGIKDPDNGQTNTSTVWLNWAAQAPNFSIHLTWSY